MLRQLSLLVVFVFVSLFTLGLPSRSLAQTSSSSSWAATGPASMLVFSVRVIPNVGSVGFGGYCGVSSAAFSFTGDGSNLVNSKDANGNFSSVVTAIGSYAPIVNGVKGSLVTAKATITLKKMANGASSEGVTIVNYSTGSLLYTSGVNLDGSPLLLPLLRGSILITVN